MAQNVDLRMGKKLNQAIEHMNANRFNEAREMLDKINLKRASPYEISRVQLVYSAIAQAGEKYDEAREHLKIALQSGGLSEQEEKNARFQIAQMLIAQENWKEGIVALNEWFATGAEFNSLAYFLLAMCHYQLNNYNEAVGPAQKAVDLSDNPQDSYLSLLLALRIQREEQQLAIPILKRLIARAPEKKTWWIQLAYMNSTLNKFSEALSVMQIAYYGNLLTESSEYRNLVDLLMQEEIPYRAAGVLSRAIADKKVVPVVRDWEKLATCWMQAREYDKAVEPLNRAATLSNNSEMFKRLADLHSLREDWQATISALKLAFEKGGLKDEDKAQMLMGAALYKDKRLAEARVWFQKALASPRTKTVAEEWIKYLKALEKGSTQ